MTGLELAPLLYALPVAMAMFANSDRHSTMEKVSRRQRRHQQRSSAWMQQELSNESVPEHQRTTRRGTRGAELQQSLSSPSLAASTSIVIEIEDEVGTSLSVEMTLEDYHQS